MTTLVSAVTPVGTQGSHADMLDTQVTLLAALACRSIAVPLSPAFPSPELQYVIDHSEASLLVSSTKLLAKADDVLSSGLAVIPKRLELRKHQGGAEHEVVSLEGEDAGEAGMMLYTSGTTNRPVCLILFSHSLASHSAETTYLLMALTERSFAS